MIRARAGGAPPSATLGREVDAERDQGGAGEGLERPPEPGPAQDVARPGDRDGIEGQPGEREKAEHAAEKDQGPERSAPAGDELRKQTREEHRHLRVPEVAKETLAKRGAWSEPVSQRLRGTRPGWAGLGSQPLEDRPSPEEDQVARAQSANHTECRSRCGEKRGQPEAGPERPDRLTARDADRGQGSGPSASEERVPDRQCGVRSRRDDHERGEGEERGEALEHGRSLAHGAQGQSGRQGAPGLYFGRLSSGHLSARTRLVVLR